VRRLTRGLVGMGSGVLCAVGAAGVAHGSTGSTGSTSGSDNPGGTVTVGASGGGSTGGGPAGPGSAGLSGTGGSGWTCTDLQLVVNNQVAPGGPTPGSWYSVTCTNAAGSSVTKTEWIPDQAATPPAPGVDPYSVALQAEHSIVLPQPAINVNPAGAAVVNLPTWLWIDPSSWHSYSVSASVGSVVATAVATPVTVRWSMGDGGSVVCDGPGTNYDTSLPATQQVTGCSYSYRVSSAGQPAVDGSPDDASFLVTATETWAVSWSAQGVAGGGVLPALTTSSSIRLQVEQVESIDAEPSVQGGGGA